MSIEADNIPSIRELFLAALELDSPEERRAFLDRNCGGDAKRRHQLERLLASTDDEGQNPLDQAIKKLNPSSTTIGVGGSLNLDVSDHPTIDNYKLLEKIGEGGMGTVFMAQQLEPVRRVVALKLIKPGMDSREVVARFEAERQALAMMDHPHIARVLDAGTTAAGRPYFVMELVRGVPITNYCDQHSLSIQQRLRLFTDVCRAVQHAHQKGIIHRDLKPSNIMITLHDEQPVVKVIDFGVAKALDQELTERTLFTKFSQMIGTPTYMSPEQAELSGLGVDTRSDVYSLGVLLYELLTGTTPFDKTTLSKAGFDDMRRMIREEEPPRPSHRISTLDARLLSTVAHHRQAEPRHLSLSLRHELDWIVMRALEKDRNRRYDSASGLAQDVWRYLDGEPVLAHPPSPVYRLKKAAVRHRGILIAGLLTVGALVGGATASIWQAVRAERARRLADMRSVEARNQQSNAELQTRLARLERDRANRANERAQTLLYVSDMKLASDAIVNDDLPRAAELLARHVPAAGERDLRGLEWHYYQKRIAAPVQFALAQDDWIDELRCSPDGLRLAVTSGYGTVRVYDTNTWHIQQTLVSPAAAVNGLGWSHDGLWLATACTDGRLRIWNASSGEQHSEIAAHEGEANDVAFSRDGRVLYSCGDDAGVCAWDLETGKRLKAFRGHPREVEQIALSADQTNLATAGSEGSFAIWDTTTAQRLFAYPQTGTRVVCVAFSPDDRRVAAGDIHGGVYLANRKTGAWRQLAKLLDGIEDLAFVPGGKWLATIDRGGAVQLHPLDSVPNAAPAAEKSPRWIAHQGRGLTIAVSPDGDRIISGGRDNVMRVWQPNLEASRWALTKLPIKDFAISSPHRLYAVGQNIHPWDLERRHMHTAFAPADPPWQLTACAVQTQQLAAVRKTQLALFDLDSGSLERSWDLNDAINPFALAISSDGRWIALADWTVREAVQVFDLRDKQPPRSLAASQCECLEFAPDGNRLAVGHLDDLRVYDLQSNGKPLELKGHSNTLADVAFSPDGTLLATVSHDRLLKIWDAASGHELFSQVAHRAHALTVDFSPDGRTIVTGGRDGQVKLWHTATGQPLGTVASEPLWIRKARFSSDGRQLALQMLDYSIIVFDADTAN